jgi:hypothetical protein
VVRGDDPASSPEGAFPGPATCPKHPPRPASLRSGGGSRGGSSERSSERSNHDRITRSPASSEAPGLAGGPIRSQDLVSDAVPTTAREPRVWPSGRRDTATRKELPRSSLPDRSSSSTSPAHGSPAREPLSSTMPACPDDAVGARVGSADDASLRPLARALLALAEQLRGEGTG